MIGAISETPHRQDRCNQCRHWSEDTSLLDPNDEDWGFGECRREAPVLVSSLVAVQIEPPVYGHQTDLEVGVLKLFQATRFPVTSSTDWCGRYMQREG